MNELVEVPLPGFDERLQMLKMYLISNVLEPASKKDCVIFARLTLNFLFRRVFVPQLRFIVRFCE